MEIRTLKLQCSLFTSKCAENCIQVCSPFFFFSEALTFWRQRCLLHGFSPSLVHCSCAIFALIHAFCALFQSPLGTCLVGPCFTNFSVRDVPLTIYAPTFVEAESSYRPRNLDGQNRQSPIASDFGSRTQIAALFAVLLYQNV